MQTTCLRFLAVTVVTFLLFPSARAQYDEKYRGQYHFSPNSGWIGDPDGMFKWKGKYHLYWWGHASSTDLVHWTQHPYPIVGDPGSYSVNTGSAVVDADNDAGFGANAVLGVHTLTQGWTQAVGLSSSTDSGMTLNLYGSNPVLGPSTNDDFRDPQVFWHQPSGKWIMVLARGHLRKISIYNSDNLKSWTWKSDFGPSGGYSYDNWETPDLFPLYIDNNPDSIKWVMTVAAYPTAGGGGDTVRQLYHIGTFDGESFDSDHDGVEYRLDHGKDFYAARTWRDYDSLTTQKRRTILGWMGSWAYAQIAPSEYTYKGKGVMSLPRDLGLKRFAEGLRVVQNPIPELTTLRQSEVSFTNKSISGTNNITSYGSFTPNKNVYEFDATFSVSSATFGFNVCVGSSGTKKLVISYNGSTSILTINRSTVSDNSMNTWFNDYTASAYVPAESGKLRLRVFVDQSSVEVFTNQGKVVLSMLTYPGTSQTGIEIFSTGGTTTLDSFKGWALNSIWNPANGYRIKDDAVYKIECRDNGKVLDSPSEAPGDGTPLQQWSWLGGDNQKWVVDSLDHWHYKITSVGSGKVIDLDAGSSSNGAEIQQWAWQNNDNQKWKLEDIGGGFFKIVNKGTGKIVEVEGGNDDNGREIQQWKFIGYNHQSWKFVKVADGLSAVLEEETAEPVLTPKGRFSVFPNPATGGIIHIVSPASNTSRSIHQISIMSANGQVIRLLGNLKGQRQYDVPTIGLAKQMYFIRVHDGSAWETHKIFLK